MAAGLVAGAAPLPATGGEGEATAEIVVDGLRNPRGITNIASDSLYVAEAGNGGDDCVNPDPEDEEWQLCFGLTGRIFAVDPFGGKGWRRQAPTTSMTG